MERAKQRMVLLVATTAGFLSTFMASALNMALKHIEGELGFSAVTLGWIQLAYILAAAALLMPIGRLADVYGRKRFFAIGIAAFSVLVLAGSLASSAPLLIALRFCQGVATAFLFSCTTAMVALAHPLEERGRALGLQVGGVYLGLALGPVLGGLITDGLGWRYIFVFVGAAAVVDTLLTLGKLRGIEWREQKRPAFDVRGSVVWAVGLAVLLAGFSFLPGKAGWAMIVAGAGGVAAFLWLETKATDPILDVGLLRRNRVFAFSNLATFINYAATYAMTFLMSLYLLYNKRLSPWQAALVLVTGTVVQTIASPLAGRLSDRLPARYLASAGMGICVLGLGAFIFLGVGSPYWYIIATLCVLGLGFAFFATPIVHAIMGSVDQGYTGVASATISTMRLAGQSVSIGLATLVLALLVGPHEITDQDLPDMLTSIRVSFAIFTVLCIIGVAASLVGPRRETAAQGGAQTSG